MMNPHPIMRTEGNNEQQSGMPRQQMPNPYMYQVPPPPNMTNMPNMPKNGQNSNMPPPNMQMYMPYPMDRYAPYMNY